jgi:hypothetical protein
MKMAAFHSVQMLFGTPNRACGDAVDISLEDNDINRVIAPIEPGIALTGAQHAGCTYGLC